MRSSPALLLCALLLVACDDTSPVDAVDGSSHVPGALDASADAQWDDAGDGALAMDGAAQEASTRAEDASQLDDAGQTADAGDSDASGSDASTPDAASPRPPLAPVAARIPAPCSAALPTGWCLVSEPGHFVGQGRSDAASGAGSLTVGDDFPLFSLSFALLRIKAFKDMQVELGPIAGQSLKPALYTPAAQYGAEPPGRAVLNVTGDGRACSQSTGRYALDELELGSDGSITRVSATFEQSCGGGPMLRGVVHFNATGQAQPSAVAGPRLALPARPQGLVYDAAQHAVFGWDPVSRTLMRVALTSGNVTSIPVDEVPAGACIDSTRQLLLVGHRAPFGVGEYRLDDLQRTRLLQWENVISPTTNPMPMLCGKDRLFITMGGVNAQLTVVQPLGQQVPSFQSQKGLSKVGALAGDASDSRLFVLRAEEWSNLNPGSITRLDAQTFVTRDVSSQDPARALDHDPITAPLLYDEAHGVIAARNRVLDASNLTRVLRSFPSHSSPGFPLEFASAIDAQNGLLATNHFIYTVPELTLYTTTLVSEAPLRFFDRDGVLWHLLPDEAVLAAQRVLP